jgi:hypothetical protein
MSVLFTISTHCYTQHPTRDMNCHCLSLAVEWLSTNGNKSMNPHTITYYNQSGLVLLSRTEDWHWPVCLLPWPASCPCLVLLIHFAPYPPLDSTALNNGLSVNNELQRKWLGLIWRPILRLSKTKKHLHQDSKSLGWDSIEYTATDSYRRCLRTVQIISCVTYLPHRMSSQNI